MNHNDEIQEENRRLNYLRFIVDLTMAQLHDDRLSILEAIQLIHSTKKMVLKLFPEKEDAYDLIYKRRFARVLEERLKSN